ncbi:MAG: fimbrial protein [Kluyvera intermedia]
MNNKIKTKWSIFGYCLLLPFFQCWGGDSVPVRVTGAVTGSPCKISNDSVQQTIDLGQDISNLSLKTPGSSTDWVDFDINLEACPEGTQTVSMSAHGTSDDDSPADMYKNTGDATNVAIQVQSQTGEALGDGKTLTGTIVNSAYSYKLRARIYSQKGKPGPGEVSASMTVTFEYQ